MASIANDPGGRRRIQFVAPDGSRKAIRLGKVSQRAAEQIKFRVEQLLATKLAGHALDDDTARWIAGRPDALAEKLARVGLIPSRKPRSVATMQAFVDGYIAQRSDASPHTRRIWGQTGRRLAEYFGAERPIAEITRGQAADWRLSLVSEGLADASVRKHCGFAKHFMGVAVTHELISANPFAKLVSAPVGNDARQHFVTREDTQRVLKAAPDDEWRLIIALSRYGGLRCPSEHLALTRADVDWEQNRLTVRSPKTARHAGHASRVVPLFPELRPYLEAVLGTKGPATEHVIKRYRDGSSNMRTQFARIIRRAGLTPWPRITHNLRASRATELAAEFPAHVAAAWLGHSAPVAAKHYWQVTKSDFDRALKGGAESGARKAQNEAQQAHAACRGNSHEASVTSYRQGTLCEKDLVLGDKMAEVHGNRTHLPRGSRATQRF